MNTDKSSTHQHTVRGTPTTSTGVHSHSLAAVEAALAALAARVAKLEATMADVVLRITKLEAPPVTPPTPPPVEPPPTTEPPVVPPAVIDIYGPAIGADDLNNTHIGGPYAQAASYRFRAEQTSSLTGFRIYVINGHAGYSAGTGGTIRATLETDDGSSSHFPSGTVLATKDFVPSDGAGNAYSFASPPGLTTGTIYHLVFRNIDANPAANYASLDGTFQATADRPPWQPRFVDTDFVQLLKAGSGAWTDSRGDNSVITPMLDLTYGNGAHQGMGYIETWGRGGSDGYNVVDGTIKLRETFTVSDASRTVSSIWVRLARTSGTAPLSIRLETSAGIEIETVSIAHGSIRAASKGGHGFGQRWYEATFSTPRTLAVGSAYNLQLSTTTGTEYWTTAIRQGSSYGYTAATYFADGHMERNAGSSWTDVLSLSGNPSNEGDLQFYLTVIAA